MVTAGGAIHDTTVSVLQSASKVSAASQLQQFSDGQLGICLNSSINQDQKYHVNHFNRVPLVVLEPKMPATITTIVSMKERYHLSTPPTSGIRRIDGSVRDSRQSVELLRLQELVLQIKRSKGSKLDDSISIHPSKDSGLPNYCTYLRGKSVV
jgi:hypothetical protein